MSVLLSQASIEPGIFGIFRPVLLWPRAISEHLDDAHLEAVIAHELWHVRRRDNLAAGLHMLVEALFWFHPLVWWIGAFLIQERERACDEAVLEIGGPRQAYAESILKVCEFCLSSPLTCVSGVTGSDLKKRMVHIMTHRVVAKLNFPRKLLLWTVACLTIALPFSFGFLNAAPAHAESGAGSAPKFASVSIKPHATADNLIKTKMMMSLDNGSLTAQDITVQTLIQLAYHVQDAQLAGAPEWLSSQRFDINATVDPSLAAQMRTLSDDQRGLMGQHMLQALLADHFKLALHQESRDLLVYELVVADGGSKLQQATGKGMMHMGMGELTAHGTPLSLLAAQLSLRLGRPVIDKTGLNGNYAFSLRWTPDADEQARLRASSAPGAEVVGQPSPSPDAPPLSTAIQEQLGLTLQPQTERVPVLVVDHVEQPSE